jgi:hypothetical protein
MLSRLRTALKFLTYGVLIGIFFAPDRGEETRKKVMNRVSGGVRDMIGNVTGGNSQSQ